MKHLFAAVVAPLVACAGCTSDLVLARDAPAATDCDGGCGGTGSPGSGTAGASAAPCSTEAYATCLDQALDDDCHCTTECIGAPCTDTCEIACEPDERCVDGGCVDIE